MTILLQTAEVVEAEPTRVLGVGIGVFLIAFFFALALLLFVVGAALGKKGIFFGIGTGIFLLVCAILFGADRGSQYVIVEETVQDYSALFYPRVVFAAILGAGALMAAAPAVQMLTEQVHTEVMDDLETRRKRHFL
mmetsp:Transcript_22900/g.34472  ORF Transcript_22900/g.34472 Transcript_22900/m.34472 type:complete len:136 (+) Transcript_22900:200-607(+)|eukprot:CAMPEP_0194569194 /NCGR_PEP_ID=MMETSP0292-20121207/7007_1 /TAXON_ID=39354 /ORGANISM="Heterosigma akashiwo, Strain CCMP2393" /LENGTH=135 /DNA_ID=CAMNT_0039419395 /DNA_START=201 /DNA_END=608 /DNA_ORIENTATION=+